MNSVGKLFAYLVSVMTSLTPRQYITYTLLIIIAIPIILILLGAIILIPAFDLLWLEGWIFILGFTIWALFYFVYFLVKNPQTLLNRGKYSADPKEVIFNAMHLPLVILIVVIPGLERVFFSSYRFIFSLIPPLPYIIELLGFIGLIVGLCIIFLANRENTFASKGVRIHEGHRVIKTGPYAIIRHPMYAGAIIVMISIPIALGSVVALLPAILLSIGFLLRIRWEEALLLKELEEYTEYTKKVRYKLIPKIY